MAWSIEFSPLIPLWGIGAFAGIALLLSFIILIGRQQGGLLRVCAFIALLLALLNPAIEQEEREKLASVVALVIDQSQSQKLENRPEITESAREVLSERLSEIEDFELRIIEAGQDSQFSQSDGTELFKALEDGLSDVPPNRIAGALMITDGQVHDTPKNVESLEFDAPVHALITGQENEIDRQLILEKAPKFGLVGTEQVVNLRLIDQVPEGHIPVESTRVSVRRDGKAVSTVTVRPGVEYSVPVEIEHGGDNIFEFEVEELENELTLLNNRLVVTIDGIRENLRVLLISGEPYAGERTWRNLLKSDASVDLVHFTILRPPEKQDGTPINELSLIAFPIQELFVDKIHEFDLIVLDRYQQRGVLPAAYYDNIAQYVKNGGALLLASGPEFSDQTSIYLTPLNSVIPAEPSGNIYEEPYHAKVTKLGLRHPVTRTLPGITPDIPDWSQWFRHIDARYQEGDVIMSGVVEKPLLILNHQVEGRIALLLSDHSWLWARGFNGGGPHVPLLRNIVHWLMKEPDLSEEALKVDSNGAELLIERQTLGEQIDPITVTNSVGFSQQIELEDTGSGLWQATIPTPEIGLYTVTDGNYTALTNVGTPNPREFSNVKSTTEILNELTTETKGTLSRIVQSGNELTLPRIVPIKNSTSYSGNGWIGLKSTNASILKGVDRYPLIFGFLGLAILLGAISLTWYREGR